MPIPVDFTLPLYNSHDNISNMEHELLMKIRTVHIITYGAFFIGALLMLLAVLLPAFSGHMVLLMYVGGAIGALGALFCLYFARLDSCPGCREFVIIKRSSSFCCPCCNVNFDWI